MSAGDESVAGDVTFAFVGRGAGDQLHDPGAAPPVGLGVLWRLFGPELPAYKASVPPLDIRCRESDLAHCLELAADLAGQGHFVGFVRQYEVGPLPKAPVKNRCVVCKASAWIRTPLRSSVLSSSLSSAFSLASWVS